MKRRVKKVFLFPVCTLLFLMCAAPCPAQDRHYRIEALQVTAIEPFNVCYQGFVDELAKQGIIEGKNLTIERKVIDFDAEKAGLWKKIGVLMRIKGEASRIADKKPDLALTIGTPATKYAKDRIIGAGIPVVFASVAIPEAAGCRSLDESGPGFTGSSLYMDMENAMKILKLAFPTVTTLGTIHSDDENAIAHVQDAARHAPAFGMKVVSRQVKSKSDKATPYALELLDEGADLFFIPLDSYYGLRNYEPSFELERLAEFNRIPGVSFVLMDFPGACLYMGSDFGINGAMAAGHAAKILKDGVRPESLPIAHQQDLNVLVDIKAMKKRGVELPMEILQIAKPVN
jgi:putative ABC transport system substrate-binding protein